jgi:uncharacterized DUF497 family protein
MITFDEAKRQANIEKHGLDLADAEMVYYSPSKVTFVSPRNDENRKLDLAMVKLHGVVLALAYVERGEEIRVISLRRASRQERRLYEAAKQN